MKKRLNVSCQIGVLVALNLAVAGCGTEERTYAVTSSTGTSTGTTGTSSSTGMTTTSASNTGMNIQTGVYTNTTSSTITISTPTGTSTASLTGADPNNKSEGGVSGIGSNLTWWSEYRNGFPFLCWSPYWMSAAWSVSRIWFWDVSVTGLRTVEVNLDTSANKYCLDMSGFPDGYLEFWATRGGTAADNSAEGMAYGNGKNCTKLTSSAQIQWIGKATYGNGFNGKARKSGNTLSPAGNFAGCV
jgi:hypothetical protein